MHYVLRDDQGTIIALALKPFRTEVEERLSLSHPEIKAFLSSGEPETANKLFLSQSDSELSRILEDLVDVLVDRSQITFTELPDRAQKKLLERKRARQAMSSATGTNVLDENDTL